MKIGKRGWLAIGVSGALVAAAIAIPVGIVYGVTAPSTTRFFDYTTNAAKNIALKWGTKPESLAVPALDTDTGLTPAEYKGVFKSSTFSPAASAVGEGKATITYEYQGPDGVATVTYALNVEKGDSLDLSKAATAASQDFVYGTKNLPAESGFGTWLYENGYGYKPSTTAPVQYFKADGTTPLTASDLDGLALGETFTARYTAELDTEHYNATLADGTTALPATATYSFLYTVTRGKAATPGTTTVDYSLAYKTKLPVPSFEGYEPAKLDNAKAKVTKAAATPTETGALTPAVGDTVVPGDVEKYSLDTEFQLVYDFVPLPKYDGTAFTYTQNFKIIPLTSIAPKQEMLKTAEVNYATTTTAGANVALPTKATAPTESAKLGGSGYDDGSVGDAVTVTGQEGTPNNVDMAKSPTSGTLTWAQLADTNAGTVFTVDVTYKPLPGNTTGTEVVLKKTFKILPQVKTPANDVNENADKKYNSKPFEEGGDVDAISQPFGPLALQKNITADVYYLVQMTYYNYWAKAGGPAMTKDQVKALKFTDPENTFTVYFIYAFNSNYTVAKNFVQQPGGRRNGEVQHRVAYIIKDPSMP